MSLCITIVSFPHAIACRRRPGDNVLYNVLNAPIIWPVIPILSEVDRVRKAMAAVLILLCLVVPASAKVYKAKDIPGTVREKVAGGEGNLDCRYAVASGAASADAALQVIGMLKLEPGCSIGFHKHAANEETYVFISGTGIYTDTDGAKYDVAPGDMTVTSKGESHGLANNGKTPLVWVGVIAQK